MERNLRNVLHILSNLKHEGGEEILFDEGCKLMGNREIQKMCKIFVNSFSTPPIKM